MLSEVAELIPRRSHKRHSIDTVCVLAYSLRSRLYTFFHSFPFVWLRRFRRFTVLSVIVCFTVSSVEADVAEKRHERVKDRWVFLWVWHGAANRQVQGQAARHKQTHEI